MLYVDEVNLLHDHLVDVLLDAAAMGRVHIERDGVSHSHDARFVLIGTMTALVPYMLCAAGLMQLMVDRREAFPVGALLMVVIASIAFIFALWALYGSGAEAVFWGFLVLVAGIPIYTWRKWRSGIVAAKAGLKP